MQEALAYFENVWTTITDLIDHLHVHNLSFYLSQIYTYDFYCPTSVAKLHIIFATFWFQ